MVLVPDGKYFKSKSLLMHRFVSENLVKTCRMGYDWFCKSKFMIAPSEQGIYFLGTNNLEKEIVVQIWMALSKKL